MNNIKFSVAEQAFYDSNYHTPPDDVMDISDDEHMRLVNGMNDGERHGYIDENGGFALSDRKPSPLHKWDHEKNEWYISDDDSAAMNIAGAESRKSSLLATAAIEIEWRKYAADKGIATSEEESELDVWNMYRVQLMRVDTTKAPDIEWPPAPAA